MACLAVRFRAICSTHSHKAPQGVCSDGLLAWRCFVIFGKRRWVKWLLTTVLLLDFRSCLRTRSADATLTKLTVISTRRFVEYRIHRYHPLTWISEHGRCPAYASCFLVIGRGVAFLGMVPLCDKYDHDVLSDVQHRVSLLIPCTASG
jgi:hypothetical protein